MLRAYVSPYQDDDADDCGLDDVGPLAVLGAMVEQRKRSTLLPAVANPLSETAEMTTLDAADAEPRPTEPKTPDESGSHPRQRLQSGVDPVDLVDVFQKIR